MAVAPLNVAPTAPAANAFDFSPLARLAQQINQPAPQAQPASLASLAPQGAYPAGGTAPVPYAASGAGGYGGGAVGGNVQSWYDFARKPLDQGGLGALRLNRRPARSPICRPKAARAFHPGASQGTTGPPSARRSGAAIVSTPCKSMRPITGLIIAVRRRSSSCGRNIWDRSVKGVVDALTAATTPNAAKTNSGRRVADYERKFNSGL